MSVCVQPENSFRRKPRSIRAETKRRKRAVSVAARHFVVDTTVSTPACSSTKKYLNGMAPDDHTCAMQGAGSGNGNGKCACISRKTKLPFIQKVADLCRRNYRKSLSKCLVSDETVYTINSNFLNSMLSCVHEDLLIYVNNYFKKYKFVI